MLIPIKEIWPFSDFSLLFGRTYEPWLEKNIQNIVFDVKFDTESDPIFKIIHKIY